MDDALGRDERPGVFIVVGDEAVGVVDQFLDAAELASPGEQCFPLRLARQFLDFADQTLNRK